MPTAAADESKVRMSNNIYTIPGASHQVSIRDAAYYCVGEVLPGIDGGRAKIKDVIDKINKIFLSYNPDGWNTKNPQKRAPKGGFTVPALRRIGKAPPPANPGRWAMKPTFRVGGDDELILIRADDRAAADDDDETEDLSGAGAGAGADTEDAADSGGGGGDDDEISDIETQ
jgi:hypothetical protein